VRNAVFYGPVCPVGEAPDVDLSSNEWPFLIPNGPVTSSLEDCLRLNIWTPGLGATTRRPVMVWLHADGFGGGSSQKFLSSDGENLARTQNVVVVSLNHRVGPLGFSNLAGFAGSEFADSPNVGMLDIVAALHWIRENITGFGGDPGNITLFGQSGGGFKISVLLAMPAAAGLFHKAIIQSGARLRVHEPEVSARLAEEILSTLGLAPGPESVRKIQQVPVADYLTAAATASTSLRKQDVPVARWASPAWWFEPTSGLPSLPDQPCDPDAPAVLPEVPVICGTVLNEVSPSVNAPEMEAVDWAGVEARLGPDLGDRAADLIAETRRIDPQWKPVEVLSVLLSRKFRIQAGLMCERVARRGTAPVYSYIFSWGTPLFDGRPRAYHTSDVAFVFANTDLVDTQTGGGPRPRRLAEAVSGAWAEFARTGIPAHRLIPSWPAFSPGSRETMVFDDHCHVAVAARERPGLTRLFDLGRV